MPYTDLPFDELVTCAPTGVEPEDFDGFWARTVAEARADDLDLAIEPADTPIDQVDVADVTFTGFGGTRVKAWFLAPQDRDDLTTIVQFVGYGGGRGVPHEHLFWPCAGYGLLVMDVRGQGSAWGGGGQTPDDAGTDASYPGFMTRGIASPETYYYRRVMADAVRALDSALMIDRVDPTRIGVAGTSQGGGLAIAAAGLAPAAGIPLAFAMAQVPFLCDFPRALDICGRSPYAEVVQYLRTHRNAETVLSTLSYFDAAFHARRATAPALFGVGLQDETCPPSTVYAAFNSWAGPREMIVYRYNDHEGGGPVHALAEQKWLAERI